MDRSSASLQILAHGLGGRSDLPIPLWMAIYGGAAALLISFFALAAFWTKPRLKGDDAGRPLGQGFERFVDSIWTRNVLRLLSVLLFFLSLAIAVAGPNDSAQNPVPTWFYVWFWVGLVPVSILFGPVWKVVNPLRILTRGIVRFVHGTDASVRPIPERMGYWPAVGGLAAFLWLELVYDEADGPLVVAIFIILYSVMQAIGGARFGERWHERGDGFEVYANLIARMSPLGRRSDGRLVFRSPFNGLSGLPRDPALVPVVAVILGSTAFDGLTRTEWWVDLATDASRPAYLLLGTAGLAACILFVLFSYRLAVASSKRFMEDDASRLDGAFIHSLIPIAVGYTVAHYFSLFVFQGQAGYILASDPLYLGWDLFGISQLRINYTAVSTSLIAYVQILSIVTGHIFGVVAAHDRAVEIFPEESKSRAQYSLLAVMVLYTTVGIALLVGT